MNIIIKAISTSVSIALLVFFSTFLLVSDSYAENISHPDSVALEQLNRKEDVKQGTLLFKSDNAFSVAPLLNTNVEYVINGMIARATIRQEFENITNDWQEGVYVFPLPEEAAVDQLRMIIGERIIEGQIKPREQAKKIYQQAKQSGKKASLIEQERPNIFTNSVANIGPGEKITIEIQYQEVIRYDSGKFNLRFPMVVAPRYIPGTFEVKGFSGNGWAVNTEQVEDAERITPPVIEPESAEINPVSISIDLNAGFKLDQIHSPYHEIHIDEAENLRYQIRLKNNTTPANRDFELVWQPELTQNINAALFNENINGDDYALLMLLPNVEKAPERLQREMIFVIDTSGSMAGESLQQAKSALFMALDRLQPGDRFNVIQFNSFTESLFNTPENYSIKSLAKARQYINGLTADGGTEMLSAMTAALQKHNENYQLRQVIFMTDGSIGNEDALFRVIETQLDDTRLFPVGIGSAPNSYFMNRAAKFGRGTFTYIGKTKEVKEKMSDLFNKIENPVLTNINLNWDINNNNNIETWPQSIPELYQGEPLLVAIKSKQLPTSVNVSGHTSEKSWNQKLFLNGGQEQNGIAKLWARRKIAALMDLRIGNSEKESIEKQITDVALEHHLVSKFTSLVAVDVTPSRNIETDLITHALKTNLPHGWQHDKVFGPMPQTATPALLHLVMGLLMMGMSLPLKLWRVKPNV